MGSGGRNLKNILFLESTRPRALPLPREPVSECSVLSVRISHRCVLFVQDVGQKNGERLLFPWGPLEMRCLSPQDTRESQILNEIELHLHEDCFVH